MKCYGSSPTERPDPTPSRHANQEGVAEGSLSTTNCSFRRDVLAESLMLTGDENIIDINAAVFWRIRDGQIVERWGNLDRLSLQKQLSADA